MFSNYFIVALIIVIIIMFLYYIEQQKIIQKPNYKIIIDENSNDQNSNNTRGNIKNTSQEPQKKKIGKPLLALSESTDINFEDHSQNQDKDLTQVDIRYGEMPEPVESMEVRPHRKIIISKQVNPSLRR